MSDEFIEEEEQPDTPEENPEEEFVEQEDDLENDESPEEEDVVKDEEDLFEEENESEEEYVEEEGEETYEESEESSVESYSEETEESWFSRLGDAVKGVIIGGLIFLIGFPILFWNEGRSVKRYRVLKQGAGSVISISADKIDPKNNGILIHITGLAATDEILSDGETNDAPDPVSIKPDKIDPKNNGKLVHVTGLAEAGSRITDPDFGFTLGAIKLQRTIQMYQWQENKGTSQTDKKLGGKTVTKTTYTYKKVWSDELIPSDTFKQQQGHVNPKILNYKNKTMQASKVILGAFTLPQQFIKEINEFKPLKFKKLPSQLPASLKDKVLIDNGALYIGKDPKSPQIGDIKVSFKAVRSMQVSLIAKQDNKTFTSYKTPSGKEIAQFIPGTRTIDEMAMPSGISVNAIKLKRAVAMYQWKENKNTKTEKEAGGGQKKITTYSYEKVWSESLIDSNNFKKIKGHANPKTMAYQGKTITAKKVSLGAFDLPEKFVNSLNNYESMTVNAMSSALPENLRDKAKILQDGYYIGKDPKSPQIGDIKVNYSIVKPIQVSLVAAQSGKSFAPYKSKGSTSSIEEFKTGTHNAKSMIGEAQKRNTTMAWILRVAGFLAMFIGLTMVFKPLSVVMDVIPFLGNIAEKGAAIVAFLIAGFFALITIAVAWFFYRPLLSLILIAIGVAMVFGVKMLRQRKANVKTPKSAPPPLPDE